MRDTREVRDTRRERERETLPCVRSKRFGVYFQKARVLCDTGVLNVTYTRERFSVQDKKKRARTGCVALSLV